MDRAHRHRSTVGRLLRHWRTLRGLSQLTLALRIETTTRHLSYVENGRSRPGRELVLRLAEALDVPLRGRNELLAAAGLAIEFPQHAIESPALAPYRTAVLRIIEGLHPFPAFVIDAMFNLRDANGAGRRMLPGIAEGKQLNLIDAYLAPGPARAQLANFPEVAWSFHARLLRATAALGVADGEMETLLARLEGYLQGVPRPDVDASGDLVVCPTFRIGAREIRTIGMTMRFGPSRDVTLEELTVDLLYPRDAQAETFFRELSESA